jgi:hypothetical protein
MKTRLLDISSAETLQHLQQELRRGLRRRFTGFEVHAPGANENTNAAWRTRIERDYFACGCELATAASLIAVTAWLAWMTTRGGGWAAWAWSDLGVLIGAFVAATGLGKHIGTRVAGRRLRGTLDELAVLFPAAASPPRPNGPVARCAHT